LKRRGTVRLVLAGLCVCLMVTRASPAQAGNPSSAGKILDRTRSIMLGPKLKVQPGTWVAYIMTATPPKEAGLPKWEMRVKISLPIHADVEHPLAEGQYWMEFEFADPAMQKQDLFVVMKMLLQGDPRDKNSLKRVYITAGNRMPMELPDKYFGERQDEEPACFKADAKGCAKKGGKVRRFPKKKIYTKIGWIQATRVLVTHPGEKGRAEFWASNQVPLFGLIRGSTPSGLSLELESYGKGALSRIDEKKAVPLPDPTELEKQLRGFH
jgi:hypothetical protein